MLGRQPRATIGGFARSADEADILRALTDLEDKAGLGYIFHVRDGRGQRLDGLPDVIAIVPPVVAFLEIKTARDRVRGRQAEVLAAIAACDRVVAGIVRMAPREGELSLDAALALLRGEMEDSRNHERRHNH